MERSRIRIAVLSLLAVGAAVVGVSAGAIVPEALGLQRATTVHSQTHVVQADSVWGGQPIG